MAKIVVYQVPGLEVIYGPVLNELYYASKEIGFFKASKINFDSDYNVIEMVAEKLQIKQDKKAYTVVASKSHVSTETEKYIASLERLNGKTLILTKGSSLKICMVAEGLADCYPRFSRTMEWDTAAGQAICKYAEKQVIDYTTGEEICYKREHL